MAITRWADPFREIAAMQERMTRLFGDIVTRGRGREEELGAGAWMPAVDIYETDEAIIVKAELPGFDKDQVSVEVKDGVLTLHGERKFEKETEEENYHRLERSYGTFHRSFILPTMVDEAKVGATLKNGILEITLPKKAEAKPRQIKVAA